MPGTFGDVIYGLNVDFSGSSPVSGNININGELLVGATVSPFIRPYVPTGSNGLIVNTGPGTIDFSLANIPNSALQNKTIGLIGDPFINISGSPIALGSSGFSTFSLPNAAMLEFDDFLGVAQNQGYKLNWFTTEIQQWQPQGVGPDAGHPGIATTIANTQPAALILGDGNPTSLPILLGSGNYTVNWVIKIITLSTSSLYTLNIGLVDTKSAAQANGVYFSYTDSVNSGHWTMTTASASTRTSVDSGVAAATGWVNLGVKVVNNTSCTYFINGAQVGSSITTNIPSTFISPGFVMFSGGSPPEFLIDLMYMTFVPTTPR